MEKILILSGAGLSAESDIRTFRSNNGMWEEHNVMEVCSVEGFITDREKVLNFYDQRRKDIENKLPNEAHRMIADIKTKYMNQVNVFTQNVDDLLEKAACPDVIYLHGKLRELECEMCGNKFDIGYRSIKEIAECPECKSHALRHNVVMFGEPAPVYQRLYNELIRADLLVIIGTSGEVLPVSQFASYTKYSILNNLDKSFAINDSFFTHTFYEKATEAASRIKMIIENFIGSGEI
ncbi:MAG: NAD-dependent deacetylase [Candidatus Delongbacteria bacterium]|nr:NAD-dependent deacetylase [Candidatus Delongbacteria bacterium]